jgi:hypothetical protein
MRRSLLVFLFIPLLLNAQLFEDFSDGDFTQNPAWTGTAEKYIVNSSFQLQLNASEAGSAWLSTPYSNPGGNVEWRFWIRLNFSPSGSNYSDVFLVSDQAELSGPLNGYFLRFGEAGSLDAIELFKKQGAQNTSICRGTNGLVATSFAIHVKVVRSLEGQWTVFADQSGSGIFNLEATGTDNTFSPGGHFGFLSTFTISNSTRMYYDNIFINEEIIDNEPPQLISATTTDPFTIQLIFNEAITTESLLNASNYFLDQEIGNPATVIQGTTAAQAILTLASPLDNGKVYNLSLNNIEDLAGNIMPQTDVQVSYYEAQTNDVVINEIMADPSPVVGLPEWEFIELYNNSYVPINLNNWKLLVGTGERVIGSIQIAPQGYVILAHEDARPSLESYGSFFGFSSFQLTNSGVSISLFSDKGVLISTVSYTDLWYNDPKKKDGGWTLEQKDPTNPCGGRNNWTASNHPSGGTPGQQNSVFAISDARPKPETMKLVSENIIQIWFDQQMDQVSLGNTSAYTLSPGNINPQSTVTNPADPTFVELLFAEPFAMGTIYELKISPSILNCAGRPVLEGTMLSFGIPFPVEPNDIVINEILFNPYNNGNDFVEIYNRSTKIINLEDLRLGAVRQTIPNPPDTTLREIIGSTKLIMPGTYMLLTVSTAMVTNFYSTPTTENFVEMAQFPVYSNESGTAILVSKTNQVIDAFSYNEEMHFPLLNYVKGVSLERISVDRPSADVNNWHSAAETAGFATPGYQNSVFVKDETSEGELSVDPEIFSPDGDGRDDVTSIRYSFEEAGYTLNIQIFNAAGQKVNHLVKSTLVSQEGAVSWDGLDESGRKVPTGIYVVYAEVFNLAGTVKGYKRAVVVGTR